jgi:hypothetical protein
MVIPEYMVQGVLTAQPPWVLFRAGRVFGYPGGVLIHELNPTVPSWQLRQRLLMTAVLAVAPPRSLMLVVKVLMVGLL